MYSNLIEVFSNTEYDCLVYPLFHFFDDGMIDDEIFSNQIKGNIKLINPNIINTSELFNELDFMNNISIFVFADTIGYSKQAIMRMVNLLKNEDEMLVIGNNSDNRITHFGFNGKFYNVFSTFEMNELENALKSELVSSRFLYLIEGVYPVRNFYDFKNLYRLLSVKENFYFCSIEIHKQFNNLFIEFKEMLK